MNTNGKLNMLGESCEKLIHNVELQECSASCPIYFRLTILRDSSGYLCLISYLSGTGVFCGEDDAVGKIGRACHYGLVECG